MIKKMTINPGQKPTEEQLRKDRQCHLKIEFREYKIYINKIIRIDE